MRKACVCGSGIHLHTHIRKKSGKTEPLLFLSFLSLIKQEKKFYTKINRALLLHAFKSLKKISLR